MKRQIRKLLIGDTIFYGYAKISVPGDWEEKVYLELNGTVFDISENQWVLCIDPFVFGVWIEKDGRDAVPYKQSKYRIYISNTRRCLKNQVIRNAEAILTLDFVDCIEESDGTLLLLELRKSRIYHLNFLKTLLIFSRYYRKPELSFSRFKSFVSAYSYPRRVRIISFRQDDYYNIFPMDLLGGISRHKRFVFGLQCKNVTLPKIMETGKLVVSEVSCKYKDMIYRLGKHHSGHPPPLGSLPFDVVVSDNFSFYVPAWVESYKEIKILRTRKLGSHMLLWGEIVAEHRLTDPVNHLSTVHFLHFLYRRNRGMNYIEA